MSEEGSSHGPAAEDTAPAGPMLCMHAWGAPPAGLDWACSQQDPAPTDSDGPDVFLSSLQLGPRLESITGCLLFPVRDPPLAAAPFAATAPWENTCLRPPETAQTPPPSCPGLPGTEPCGGSLAQCQAGALPGEVGDRSPVTPHAEHPRHSRYAGRSYGQTRAHIGSVYRERPGSLFLTGRSQISGARLPLGWGPARGARSWPHAPEVRAHTQGAHAPHRGNSVSSLLELSLS